MWENVGIIQNLGFDWRDTGAIGSPSFLLFTPEFSRDEEKSLAKIVWRVEYREGGLEMQSQTYAFWPTVPHVGRVFPVPPAPPDGSVAYLTLKFIKPRFLWSFEDADAIAYLQPMDIHVEKMA
jgi:hypothetical protein